MFKNNEETKHISTWKKVSLKFECQESHILCIKAILDFLMVHDLFTKPKTKEGEDGENQQQEEQPAEDKIINSEIVLQIMIQYLLRSDILTRSVCVEGLCRLIYNKKLQYNTDSFIVNQLIVLLMLTWND